MYVTITNERVVKQTLKLIVNYYYYYYYYCYYYCVSLQEYYINIVVPNDNLYSTNKCSINHGRLPHAVFFSYDKIIRDNICHFILKNLCS